MIINKKKGVLLAVLTAICCFATLFGNAQAAAPDKVAIPVSVNLRGELPEISEDYVIKMKADDKYSPMPSEGTIDGVYTMTVTGADSTLLPKVDYNKRGIYSYTIWQEEGTDDRCIYDNSIYHLTISVVNSKSGNGLEAVVALNKVGFEDKVSEIIFENAYKTSAEVTLAAEKFLDKKAPKADQFEFVLEDTEGNEVQTVSNDVEGAIVFDTLRFNKEEEYYFSISEVKGDDPKIIYDKTVYDIAVTVTSKGEKYVAETEITVDGEAYDGEIVFNNETIPAQPKTGDNTNITLWVLLMSTALMVIAGILVKRRENN